jgi:hypothetical protein
MPLHVRRGYGDNPVAALISAVIAIATASTIGLAIYASSGQTADLLGFFDENDVSIAGVQADGTFYGPDFVSRYDEAGEFSLNDLFDDFTTLSDRFDFTGPSNGDVLTYNSGTGVYEPQAAGGGGGSGDVTGPASSNDNAIARFSGTTGKIIQDYTSNAPTITDDGVPDFGVAAYGNSTRIGRISQVTDVNGTAIGVNARADFRSTSLGVSAYATNNNSIAIGYQSTSTGNQSVGVGTSVTAFTNATAIGHDCDALGNTSTCIGYTGSSDGLGSISIGGANVTGDYAIGIGNGVTVADDNVIAIGRNADAPFAQSSAYGYSSETLAIGELVFGGSSQYFSDIYFGINADGLGAATLAGRGPQEVHFANVSTSSSNGDAQGVEFYAGAGTGTGEGGAFSFQVAPAGASGSSQNSFEEAMKITGEKEVVQATNDAVPADATLFNGSISWYLDETAGELKAKVKYSDGTIKTATLTLP